MNWYDSAQAPAPPPDVSRETTLAEAIAKMEAWLTTRQREREAETARQAERERALAMDQRECTCEQCEDETCDGGCEPCSDRACEQCRPECGEDPCPGCSYCTVCNGYH